MTRPKDEHWHVEGNFYVYDQNGKPVATILDPNETHAARNAGLIATAPGFLKLAEELVESDGNISRELRKTFEDLIARARGDTPEKLIDGELVDEEWNDPERTDEEARTPTQAPVQGKITAPPWEMADRFVDEGMALGIRSHDGTWLAYASNELSDEEAQANIQSMAEAPHMIKALEKIQTGLTTVAPEEIDAPRLAYIAEVALDRVRGDPWTKKNTTP